MKFIKDLLKGLYGENVEVPVLYGGSIKPENWFGIVVQRSVDGGLVGGASLGDSFVELVEITERVRSDEEG